MSQTQNTRSVQVLLALEALEEITTSLIVIHFISFHFISLKASYI